MIRRMGAVVAVSLRNGKEGEWRASAHADMANRVRSVRPPDSQYRSAVARGTVAALCVTRRLRHVGRVAAVWLSAVVVITCADANGAEDPTTEVRYLCDPNWGIEIYLGLFANLRKPGPENRSTVVDWRKTYVSAEHDEKSVLRRGKPLRFACVVNGRTFRVVFDSYSQQTQGVSVDDPGPRPTVAIASEGQTVLKKTVLGLCPKGGTEWPRCPDDWSVRAVVWQPDNPLVFVQRLTSEFLEGEHVGR